MLVQTLVRLQTVLNVLLVITVARNHRFVICTTCTHMYHTKCGVVTSSEYKRMQRMSDIMWFCSLGLLSTMPFVNYSMDSDISVNSKTMIGVFMVLKQKVKENKRRQISSN